MNMNHNNKNEELQLSADFIRSIVMYSHDDYLLRHILVKTIQKNFKVAMVIFVQWDIFQTDERIEFVEYSQETIPIETMRTCLSTSASLIRSFNEPTLTILPINKCFDRFYSRETYVIPCFQETLLLGDLLVFGLETGNEWERLNDWIGQILPYMTMVLFNSMNYQQMESVIRMRTHKLADKNQELLREKQELKLLISQMAHEMKGPINGVMAYVDIIRDSKDVQEIKQYLGIIKEAGRSLEHQVCQVLESYRESDRQIISKTHIFNLYECIDNVIMLYVYQAQRKDLHLEVEYSPAESILVYGDREKVKEILSNLLDNALKYTDKGSIKVKVKTMKIPKDGRIRMECMIEDTGIGIDKEYLPQVFNVFSQADAVNAEGLGLGLSIVKKLVLGMDGSIQVSSQVGVGSLFSFQIYLNEADSQYEYEPKQDTNSQLDKTYSKMRDDEKMAVLLVDDNELNRDLIREILKKHGMACQTADNGRDALEQIKTNHYSIILMDCMMPIMDGYMATRLIREYYATEYSGYNQPYIIALTANHSEDDVNRCYDVGMNDYIAKPIHIQSLLEHLDQIMDTI